jgi:hypothetical protein
MGQFVFVMNGVRRSSNRRTPNKPHKRITLRPFNMAGIGCLATVAYVTMNRMDSSDDEEDSIAFCLSAYFKNKLKLNNV